MFREEFQIFAREMEAKTGFKIQLGKLSVYTEENFSTGKVTIKVPNGDGTFYDREANDLEIAMSMYELDTKKYGGWSKQKEPIKLIGYRERNRKYPFIAQNKKVAQYKLTHEQVKRAFMLN